MEQAVDVTSIAVRIRVMSSLRAVNVPLREDPSPLLLLEPLRCFSSSSANSRTFHGYNVVMAISAAWSNARRVKMPSHMVSLEASSLVVRGTMGVSGERVTIPPLANAGRLLMRMRVSSSRAERRPRLLRGDDFVNDAVLVVVVVRILLRVENLERRD